MTLAMLTICTVLTPMKLGITIQQLAVTADRLSTSLSQFPFDRTLISSMTGDEMMTVLSSLTMVASDRAAMRVRGIGSMRQKLIDRIGDQIELARAAEAGQTFQRVKYRRVRDQETEEVSENIVKTRVRPWWTEDQDGSILLWVKYGNTNLELAKGKPAIRIASRDQLVPALETVREAVRGGELDKQIEGAVAAFKTRFSK